MSTHLLLAQFLSKNPAKNGNRDRTILAGLALLPGHCIPERCIDHGLVPGSLGFGPGTIVRDQVVVEHDRDPRLSGGGDDWPSLAL